MKILMLVALSLAASSSFGGEKIITCTLHDFKNNEASKPKDLKWNSLGKQRRALEQITFETSKYVATVSGSRFERGEESIALSMTSQSNGTTYYTSSNAQSPHLAFNLGIHPKNESIVVLRCVPSSEE